MEDEHINVAVRLRPLSADERSVHEQVIVELQEDRSVALRDPNGTVCSSSYDAVFESSASNADVFQVVVRDMLAQALLGKNATVFAYGQTGSGKTHTIEGLMGLAAEYLFTAIAETPDREFLLKVSAVEVYNEAVHDLLRRDSGRLELTEAKPGKVTIKHLREETLASASQLQRLLRSVRDHRKARSLPASYRQHKSTHPSQNAML
jgi:centromeric protein E